MGKDINEGGGDNSMETGSQWYSRVVTEVEQYQVTLGQKGAKKYKLDLLLRVARRVDEFSNICAECQTHKQEMTNLLHELSMLVQMPEKEGMKNYTKALNNIVEHLKKVHKLVDKGQYMGMGIGIGLAVGAGLGAALGSIFDNSGGGTAIGIVLGVAIGTYLDRKAKQEGRVI